MFLSHSASGRCYSAPHQWLSKSPSGLWNGKLREYWHVHWQRIEICNLTFHGSQDEGPSPFDQARAKTDLLYSMLKVSRMITLLAQLVTGLLFRAFINSGFLNECRSLDAGSIETGFKQYQSSVHWILNKRGKEAVKTIAKPRPNKY